MVIDGFSEKESASSADSNGRAEQFRLDVCEFSNNALAQYRLSRTINEVMSTPIKQQQEFFESTERTGTAVTNETNPSWIPNEFISDPVIHNKTKLTIQADCEGQTREITVSDSRKIDRSSNTQEVFESKIEPKDKTREKPISLDELIHDAISFELKTNHPELDRKTQLFVADILDQVAKGPYELPYVKYPAGLGQYKGLTKDLLKDPQRAIEATQILNELLPGNMWSVAEDDRNGWTFTLNAGPDAKLVWNKDGEVIEGTFGGRSIKDSWTSRLFHRQSESELKYQKEKVLAQASQRVHDSLVMNPDSIIKHTERTSDPNFKDLYDFDSYFQR